jgi:nucleotide-binding universal stress UspA family protein
MRILLATDGSESSLEAAQFLTRFQFSPKDEIVVLHVVSEIPYEDDYHAKIRKFIKKVSPKILNDTVKKLEPLQAKIRTLEEDGYPDITIIDVAGGIKADLIVTGARGLTGIQLFFLGSVARSVAINSSQPVLVVKHTERERHENMKVLLATDGSDCSNVTADLLTSLPFPRETELMVMNVSWSAFSDIPERFSLEINDRIKEDVARAKTLEYEDAQRTLEQTKTCVSKRFKDIQEMIRIGEPAEEILREAETFQADIIAVGCRGLKGLKGMLGSVSRRVLGHARCPVFIGKVC